MGAQRVLEAFRADLGPAAEELQRLLALPEAEMRAACKDLAARLPDLLPSDPAMAAILAEELAAAFAEAAGEVTQSRADAESGEALANARGGNPDNRGQFSTEEGPHGTGGTERDVQARKLGYRDRADLMEQSASVPATRIATIASGDHKSRCKAHEAIAVLRSNPTVKDAFGKDVRFSPELIGHYVDGRRRKDNMPKVGNLCDLPVALYAVKHDPSPDLKFKRGAIPDPLDPPRGTQRVYKTPASGGTMHAFAYVDSGLIQGWHVK